MERHDRQRYPARHIIIKNVQINLHTNIYSDKQPRRDHSRLLIDKYPTSLSSAIFNDVKQARAALADVLQLSSPDQNAEDSLFNELLAEFLANIGASLLASVNIQPITGKLASLETIADHRTLVSIQRPVHRVRPYPLTVAAPSVPSHVYQKAPLLPCGRSPKVISPLVLIKKQNAAAMRRETKRLDTERALARVERMGVLSTRVNREQELFFAALLARKRWDEQDMNELRSKVKVVVIGAGLAGLSAVDHLLKSGFSDVTVLEALDRVGGRVHSVPYGQGHPKRLEMGLDCVEQSQDNSVYTLVKELGLKDKPVKIKRSVSTIIGDNGEPIRAEIVFYLSRIRKLIQAESNLIHTHILSQSGQNVNLAYKDYMRERYNRFVKSESFFSRICKSVDYLNINSDFHPEVRNGDLALHLLGLYDTFKCKKVTLPMGIASVLDPLISQLPADRLHLNSPVQTVHWGKTWGPHCYNVHIKCFNGDVFYADHVIVTVPLGHLKENCRRMFHPALPIEKQDAIKKAGFGTVVKVYLYYKTPFWPKPVDFVWPGVETSVYKILSYTVKFTILDYHPSVLEVIVIGGTDVETMSDYEIIQEMSVILRIYFNRDVPKADEVKRTEWHTNRYFRGSHPYLSTQSSEKNISILREPLIQRKVPVVLFAGDYTHIDYKYLAHSARASGLREANRLQNVYDKYYGFDNTNP